MRATCCPWRLERPRAGGIRRAVALLGGALVACQPGGDLAGAGTHEDVAALREHAEAFDRALTAGDEDQFIALLSEDVVWMVPHQPALIGREAVRNRIRGRLAMASLELHTTLDEVQVAGAWAYVRGMYALRVTPKGGGARAQEAGKLINILWKDPSGSWQLARHIWNADHPD